MFQMSLQQLLVVVLLPSILDVSDKSAVVLVPFGTILQACKLTNKEVAYTIFWAILLLIRDLLFYRPPSGKTPFRFSFPNLPRRSSLGDRQE